MTTQLALNAEVARGETIRVGDAVTLVGAGRSRRVGQTGEAERASLASWGCEDALDSQATA